MPAITTEGINKGNATALHGQNPSGSQPLPLRLDIISATLAAIDPISPQCRQLRESPRPSTTRSSRTMSWMHATMEPYSCTLVGTCGPPRSRSLYICSLRLAVDRHLVHEVTSPVSHPKALSFCLQPNLGYSKHSRVYGMRGEKSEDPTVRWPRQTMYAGTLKIPKLCNSHEAECPNDAPQELQEREGIHRGG